MEQASRQNFQSVQQPDLLSAIMKIQVRHEEKISDFDRAFCEEQQRLLYETFDQLDFYYAFFKSECRKYPEVWKVEFKPSGAVVHKEQYQKYGNYRDAHNAYVELFRYDLPREVYERHRWIVRWRCSRLQCAYPKEYVNCVFNYYDRRTGLTLGMKSCLSKLTAAKAQVTKAKRCIENYVNYQTAKYPLFGYDESSDPVLIKYKEKLATKERQCDEAEENIRHAIDKHQKQIIQSQY